MSFSVVQIKKSAKSRPTIEVVPNNWVLGQHVFWPPKQWVTLSKDPESVPDVTTWKAFSCKVICSGRSYEIAESIANDQQYMTDSDDCMTRGTRKTPGVKAGKFKSPTFVLSQPLAAHYSAPQFTNTCQKYEESISPEIDSTEDLVNDESVMVYLDEKYYRTKKTLNGKGDGNIIVLDILRAFIDPLAVAKYSWKGQKSSQLGITKQLCCFKKTFPNFIKFVNCVACAGDSAFTLEETEKAFAKFLRQKFTYSKRDSKRIGERRSTFIRNVRKNQSFNTGNIPIETPEEEKNDKEKNQGEYNEVIIYDPDESPARSGSINGVWIGDI